MGWRSASGLTAWLVDPRDIVSDSTHTLAAHVLRWILHHQRFHCANCMAREARTANSVNCCAHDSSRQIVSCRWDAGQPLCVPRPRRCVESLNRVQHFVRTIQATNDVDDGTQGHGDHAASCRWHRRQRRPHLCRGVECLGHAQCTKLPIVAADSIDCFVYGSNRQEGPCCWRSRQCGPFRFRRVISFDRVQGAWVAL